MIDKFARYPGKEDEFAGVFGYNQSLISMNFVGASNRLAVFESPFKGQHRVYLVDLHSKQVKWLNFLGKKGDATFEGDYELQRLYKDVLIIRFSSYCQPT